MTAGPLVWTDLYGAPHALWSGLPGGHRWLICCPPNAFGAVAHALPARFKGELQLVASERLTPLQATVREWAPRGVLIVNRDLSGGPAVTVPAREVQADGLSYREGGMFPAWSSALSGLAPEGECAAASAVAALGLPVLVCAPARVAELLPAWWRATPHAALPDEWERPAPLPRG